MTEETHRALKGGEIRVVATPAKLKWHKPRSTARPIQWQPATGVTRYEWCRQRTPKNQLAYWEHLQRIYRRNPPTFLPPEVVAELNGLDDNDLSEPNVTGFRETIAEHEIHSRDPTGEWGFMISVENWRGMVCDRLVVYCMDRVTLPDSELLLRLRSWVLDDRREAFQWYPDQDPLDPTTLARYDNSIWNGAHLISPRLTQQGVELPSPTQE